MTAIEAAFALADSGKFSTVRQIKEHLQREGYIARLELIGKTLERQLKDRIDKAAARRSVGKE